MTVNKRNINREGLLLEVVGGSIAYGTNTPSSDVDIRGIYFEKKDDVFCNAPEERRDNVNDVVYYNLLKYLFLAKDNNPNILELIYTDKDEHILFINSGGEILRENRDAFLSSKARHTYCGYAMSQLKRLRNHNKWINNPQQEERPHIISNCEIVYADGRVKKLSIENLKEFDGYFATELNKSNYRIYSSTNSNLNAGVFTEKAGQIREIDNRYAENFVGTMIVNRPEFEKRLNDWKHFWEWKKNRNEKRGELEEKYGYDTKFAMHAIRLLRQGYEILTEGTVNVYRKDREELLDIKNGKWTYDEVINYAVDMESKLNDICDGKKYVVPYEPDLAKLNRLFKEIVEAVENVPLPPRSISEGTKKA